MRLRDQNKGDLALAGLSVAVVIVCAGYEGTRWARERLGRRRLRQPPSSSAWSTST
jgi:hypothetical protein